MAIEIKQTIKYEDVINALKSKLNTNIQVDFENFLNDNGLGISSNKKAVVNKLTVLNLCSAVALFISKKYQINLNTEQIVYNKN